VALTVSEGHWQTALMGMAGLIEIRVVISGALADWMARQRSLGNPFITRLSHFEGRPSIPSLPLLMSWIQLVERAFWASV
jgi:hypothetical protein